ncbi:hypothetical protein [Amycolatopsis sp. CA-126428]|uniref:hypothetical protein n=1 Tax=Amycolatopsis sp. CA-126428 TaxID=2073158 RepID=UPI0011B0855A|nr:hypothetical protein [Amycolatopsis sp. CA-126428]
MTASEQGFEAAISSAFATIAECIRTGNFGPAVSAIEELIDAGHTKMPVGLILADACFRLELERWPNLDDYGFHFRAIQLLFTGEICNGDEINNAIVWALLERGNANGSLEGQLYDMLMELLDSASGTSAEEVERLTKGFIRGPDSEFEF